MELGPVVEEISADLRRAASVGGDETVRVADLLVSGIDPMLRLHLIEVLHTAARELEDTAQGASVEVRLVGRDPVLSLSAAAVTAEDEEEPVPDLGGYAEDELLRLTIRLPEGLKSRVEHAAAGVGASINSWIVASLARALETPPTSRPQPGRRMPRRITGFVQG